MEPIIVTHDAVGYDPIPSANPSSAFNPVTATNPNEPSSVQNPLDATNQYNIYNSVFHVDPNAAVRQTQKSDQNGD